MNGREKVSDNEEQGARKQGRMYVDEEDDGNEMEWRRGRSEENGINEGRLMMAKRE